MTKLVLNAYRSFTAAAIKARASVPAQANMSVVGTTVEVENIDVDKIAEVLGVSVYDLQGLAEHANVNEWSGFGPYSRSYSNGGGSLTETLVNTVAAPDEIDEWGGYNHTAITPGLDHIWFSENIITGEVATFDAYVNLGEVKYPSPALALVLTLWDGLTMVGHTIEPLSNFDDDAFITCDTGVITSNKTITVKLFIGDSLTEFDQNGGNALCLVPNTTSYDRTVNIGAEGASDSVTFTNKGNWGITPNSTQIGNYIDYTDGKLNITNLANSLDGDITDLAIQVSISGTGVVNGSFYIWRASVNGTYYSNTQLSVVDYVVGDGGAVNLSDWTMSISFGSES
jgi:hypothetical protein